MEKIEDLLNENHPSKMKYYLEYYEMLMIMLEKRGLENDLEEDYQKLKEKYAAITDKKLT